MARHENLNLLHETFGRNLQPHEIYQMVSWMHISTVDSVIDLAPGYDLEELEKALQSMNIEYYPGYGSQEIDGIIMFNDGTWLERQEYDGSEWWQHRSVPKYDGSHIDKSHFMCP